VSPAGARQDLEQRNACWLDVTAERREARAAREAVEIAPLRADQEAWSFDGGEMKLAPGRGRSGYFGVHYCARSTTFKARLPRRPQEASYKQFSYVHVWTD
jgi:hypothetical protein